MAFKKQSSTGTDPLQDELNRLKKVPAMIQKVGLKAQEDLVNFAPLDTGVLKAAIAKASLDATDQPEPFYGVGAVGENEEGNLGDPETSFAGTISAFLKWYRGSNGKDDES